MSPALKALVPTRMTTSIRERGCPMCMNIRSSVVVFGMLCLIVSCSGTNAESGMQPPERRSDVQRPELTVPKPPISGAEQLAGAALTPRAGQLKITPGAIQPIRTPPAELAIPRTPHSTTAQDVASISEYDAAQIIAAFASEYLGIDVDATAAGGASGNVSLPAQAQAEVAATVALAGQVAVGMITSADMHGAAEVAVGDGTVSGDLSVDLSSAS